MATAAIRLGLGFVVLLFLTIALLYLPPVQSWITRKAESYLTNKLATRVEVGGLHLNFASRLVISDLYVEDQQQDTLWYSKSISLNVPVYPLLQKQLLLKEVVLIGGKANYVQFNQKSDSTNLDFILQALSGSSPTQGQSNNDGWIVDAETVFLSDVDFWYDNRRSRRQFMAHLGSLAAESKNSNFANLTFHWREIHLKNSSVSIKGGVSATEKEPTDKVEVGSPAEQKKVLAQIDLITLENCNLLRVDSEDVEVTSLQLNQVKAEELVFNDEKKLFQSNVFYLADSRLVVTALPSQQDTTNVAHPYDLNSGWNVDLREVNLDNNYIVYHSLPGDTSTLPFTLDISNFHLAVPQVLARQDTIQMTIEQLAFKDQQGLDLQAGQASIFLSNEKLEVSDLTLRTPFSNISAELAVHNPTRLLSSQALDALYASVKVHPSTVGRHDLQYLNPAQLPQFLDVEQLTLEADINGTLNDLMVHHFRANLNQEIFLAAAGSLHGLPEIKDTKAELDMEARYGSRSGMATLLPQNLPFDSSLLPDSLALQGKIRGTIDNFDSDLHLTSSVGKAFAELSYRNDPVKNDNFQAEVDFSGLNLEAIDSTLAFSNVAGNLIVSGTGLANQQYDLQSSARLDSLVYKAYTYRNVALQAQYEPQQGSLHIEMKDPHVKLMGEGHWNKQDTVQLANIDLAIGRADLFALQLTDSPFALQGRLGAQLSFDDKRWQLKADLEELEIEKKALYPISDIHLESVVESDLFDVKVHSHYFQASFNSNIHPVNLSPLLSAHFRSYFSAAETRDSLANTGYYRLKCSFDENNKLEKLLPDVEELSIATLESTFDAAQKGFRLTLDIPYFKYAGIDADSLQLNIHSDQKSLSYGVKVPRVGKDSLRISNLAFSGDLSDGKLYNQINIPDSLNRTRFQTAFLLQGANEANIALSLVPDQTILNYEQWAIASDNQILFKKDQPAEGALGIKSQHRSLNIQLIEEFIQINATNLPLAPFSRMILPDADQPLASGALNGKATIGKGEGKGQASVDLRVSDGKFMNTDLGNVEVTATALSNERLEWQFLLKNENNKATLRGSYSFVEKRSPLSVQLDVDFRDLSVFGSLANQEVTELNGKIISSIAAQGNLEKVIAQGNITFQDASFSVQQLNNRFSLENETVSVGQAGWKFSDFTLRDADKNRFVIDGSLLTQDYRKFDVDLDIEGDRFTLIDNSAKDNPEFFGKLIMSAQAHLQGQLPDLRVNANLSIDEGTQLTYVMPPSEINLVSDEGIVKFVTPKGHPPADTLDIQQHLANPLFNEISGLNLKGSLNIHRKASFRVDIDPRSGDYASVMGDGKLFIDMNKGQNLSITGTYEITKGVYEVSFYNLARKTFQIEPGSLLTWAGDPYDPVFDIQAYHIIKTASTGLVANEITGLSDEAKRIYRKSLPYKVAIYTKGNPLNTDLGFSIDLPDQDKANYPVVESKLQRINERGNESVLTQQVFGLLTIGSFIPERITDVGGDYSVAFASTAAVNSLNGILTNELNKLSGQYLKGFNVDFGLQSSQDMSSGNQGMTTMMDIKVSRSLLDERMVVEAQSSFDVNGNSNYSNSQNDIALIYDLSDEGDYKLKAFNIASYDVVYKDIRTSGISLIFMKEYDPEKNSRRKKNGRQKKRNIANPSIEE